VKNEHLDGHQSHRRWAYSEMAKALQKVQKQISKKRGRKPTSLHENSRDSQRLRTAGAREDKLAKLLAAATKANQAYGQLITKPRLSFR
jgi:hypothetical protein